jgi:hypothetical protein
VNDGVPIPRIFPGGMMTVEHAEGRTVMATSPSQLASPLDRFAIGHQQLAKTGGGPAR